MQQNVYTSDLINIICISMIFLKRGWGWEMGSFMLYFGQFSVFHRKC
jgi:hypothetical protein